MQTAPSVCVHCGVGCNTIAGERYGILRRIQNRYNSEVNGYFLCDRGRYGYEFVNGEDRIRQPLYRQKTSAAERRTEQATKEKCLQAISAFIQPAGSGIIGIGSPRASCEANFALLKFVGQENFSSGLGRRDHRLIAAILQIIAKSPARVPSLKDVERCDAVFIVGEDISNTAPRLALALHSSVRQKPMAIARKLHIPYWDDAAVREAIQDERGPLFVATPAATRLDALATATFRAAPDDLARLASAVAHALQKDAPAVPGLAEDMRSRAETIAQALRQAERPLVISGTAMGDEALDTGGCQCGLAPFAPQGRMRPFTTSRRNATAWASVFSGECLWKRRRRPWKKNQRTRSSSWKMTSIAAPTVIGGPPPGCGTEYHLYRPSGGRHHSQGRRGSSGGHLRRGERHPGFERRAGPAILSGLRSGWRCTGKLALAPGYHVSRGIPPCSCLAESG